MTTPTALLIGVISLFILYIICRIFIKPIKWFFRLTISCIIGILAMHFSNLFLSKIGLSFSINPLTAMISGVLGIPGMVITLILQNLL